MSENNCLYCRKDRHLALTFARLLAPSDPPGFCSECQSKFAPIDPEMRCLGCGRDRRGLDPEFCRDGYCSDCLLWRQSPADKYFGHNEALFSYNDWMKEVFTAFKFRGDERLAEGFRAEWRAVYARSIGSSWRGRWENFLNNKQRAEPPLLLPIPVSTQRLEERGFNQSELLAAMLDGEVIPALLHDGQNRKQSKKRKLERMNMTDNPFRLNPNYAARLSGKRLLIIDDIYTTGATLRKAAAVLAAAEPECVDSLTLIHG